jgi:hypothetical protein
MFLDQLKPDTVHLGKYLLVRVIDTPCKIHAVSTNVEDAHGSTCYLSVYHLIPGPTPVADASASLPVGSVLVIKVSCVSWQPC